MEEEKSLKSRAIIGKFTNAIQDNVDHLLANGIVASGVIVGSIFFARNELFRVKQLTVTSGANFVDDRWLQIHENRSRNVFSSTSFGEKCAKGGVAISSGVWDQAIRLYSVFETIQLPTGIS